MSHNLPYLFPSNGAPQHQRTAPHQPTPNTMPASTPSAPATMPQPPSQQAAFLQNAQLPALDMASILQSVSPEHLAAIIQLYQAGQIALPPPQTLNMAQAPVMAASPAVQTNGTAGAVQPQQEDSMALDKEEGEWEEGDVPPQGEPDFLRPPPTGPRKRSGGAHMRPDHNTTDKRAKRQPSPPQQPDSYDRRRPVGYGISSPPRPSARQRKAKHDAAKTFILAAHHAGFSFDDLAREIGDARMLEVLFRELDLQTPSQLRDAQATNIPKAKIAPVTGGSPLNVAKASKPSPAVKPAAKPAAPPKAPVPADRSAYLAKLQAAKNKKHQDSLASAQTNTVEAPIVTNQPVVQQAPPAATAPVDRPAAPQPKKVNVQTDLIRKRLEALKEEQARKREAERLANAAAASTTTPTQPNVSSRPQSSSLSKNVTPQQSTPVPQATAPIRSPDLASQFPGLPGLFMTGTPTQVPPVAHNPEPPVSLQTVPQLAPLSTTIDPSASNQPSGADGSPAIENETTALSRETSTPVKPLVASSGQATPKYPFNQNGHDSNDDSVIINVSDEEESELDDDMEDEEDAAPPAPVPAPKPTVPTAVKPGPLRNFPAPYSTSASAPGTPGTTTPGGTAYERKLQEINEMHRRIAEMQKQPKKAKAKVAPQPASAQPSALPQNTTNLPGLSTSADVAFTQSSEQQPAETSQQMEVKLAKLQQEAEIISEQRHPPQVTQPVTQSAVPSAPESAVPATSSDDNGRGDIDDDDDDDDDDAMDLSSGEDSDPYDDAPQNEIPALAASEEEGEGNQPLARVDTGGSAQMDVESTSSDDSDDSSTESEEESDGEYEPAPAAPEAPADVPAEPIVHAQSAPLPITGLPSGSPTLSQQNEIDLEDADLAPELQPSSSGQQIMSAIPETTSDHYYKPYESPLRMFKDYRFHPRYNSDVKGGFQSLTYSNKIDPTEAMCPDELSDGVCNDQTCLHQHFRDAAFDGPSLLKDLGTRKPPFKTEEDETRWRVGLSEAVTQMRNSDQGDDVDAIAACIAQFRRDFIGAQDQVLNLKT